MFICKSSKNRGKNILQRRNTMNNNSSFRSGKNQILIFQECNTFVKLFKKVLRFVKKVANWSLLLLAGLFSCHGSVDNIFSLESEKTVKKKEQ